MDFNNEHMIPKGSPFKVPEGYFDNFTANLMKQIPQDEEKILEPSSTSANISKSKKSFVARFRPYLYAAAMFSGLVFGIHTYRHQIFNEKSVPTTTMATATNLSSQDAEAYVNEFCDFARIDEQDIYACVDDSYSY